VTGGMRRAVFIPFLSFLIFALFLCAELRTLNVEGYSFCNNAHALDVPALTGHVNDYAGMISPQVKSRIEGELQVFEKSDSTQVAILTVSSLQGQAIDDFSIKVAEAWKIGQKGKDNGVLFVVARDDRKMRIEVGRGLEGRLTDLVAGRIIDMAVAPRFKRGDFDGGFVAGVHAIVDAARGEFKAEKKAGSSRKGGISSLFPFLIFAVIAVGFLGRISKYLGGAGGALGLPAIVYLALFPIGIVTVLVLAVIGFLAGFLLSRTGPLGHAWGSGTMGGWGGGWGGGGGDSGGFSGGGGDFGGGGASGDW
jgi:uncharacterized protein